MRTHQKQYLQNYQTPTSLIQFKKSVHLPKKNAKKFPKVPFSPKKLVRMLSLKRPLLMYKRRMKAAGVLAVSVGIITVGLRMRRKQIVRMVLIVVIEKKVWAVLWERRKMEMVLLRKKEAI